MPTTSDGRKFPYTADGIAAAAAHERSLKAKRKKMGKSVPKSDPRHPMNAELTKSGSYS